LLHPHHDGRGVEHLVRRSPRQGPAERCPTRQRSASCRRRPRRGPGGNPGRPAVEADVSHKDGASAASWRARSTERRCSSSSCARRQAARAASSRHAPFSVSHTMRLRWSASTVAISTNCSPSTFEACATGSTGRAECARPAPPRCGRRPRRSRPSAPSWRERRLRPPCAARRIVWRGVPLAAGSRRRRSRAPGGRRPSGS